MAYITSTDIASYIDVVNLAQMTADYSDAGSVNSTTLINNVCQLASDMADSMVSSIYTIPFTTVPAKIRMAAIAFAVEMLYQRRLTPMEHNPGKANADLWRQTLKMVNLGQLSLDNAQQRIVPPITYATTRNVLNTSIY